MLSSSVRSAFRLSFPAGLVANDIFSRMVPCENTIGHCTDVTTGIQRTSLVCRASISNLSLSCSASNPFLSGLPELCVTAGSVSNGFEPGDGGTMAVGVPLVVFPEVEPLAEAAFDAGMAKNEERGRRLVGRKKCGL